MNIKDKIASAILQEPIDIAIGNKVIQAPRPTLGTMIQISRLISDYEYSDIFKEGEDKKLIEETLRLAKDWECLAEILAWLLIGKKDAIREFKIFGFVVYAKDRIKPLRNEILNRLTPKEIAQSIFKILGSMECGFFLSTIGFLNNINHLKKTKN